ncbi:MAG TPA: phage tail protein [Pyrinomonadaceae bacterium]|nr:phage tail protein [Pyrinomonadaceae bacterium]
MDANGTKFHLLLSHDDWARCSVDGVELRRLWEAESPLTETAGVIFDEKRSELTLQSRLFKYVAAPNDTRPALSNRRGAGRDRYGNWYWIDETGFRIRVRSSGSRLVSDFWPLPVKSCSDEQQRPGQFQPRDVKPAAAPLSFSGMAVTEDHYLVAGVLQPAGLLIFDLHAGGEPRQLLWPNEVDFEPLDIVARPGGGVWILDGAHRSYWGLDSHFNLITTGDEDLGPAEAESFHAINGEASQPPGRRTFPRRLALDISSIPEDIHPIAIEALPDGTVLILDHDPDPEARFSKVYRYDLDQRTGAVSTEAMLRRIEDDPASKFRLVGYDFAFVPAHVDEEGKEVSDRIYVVSDEGNQTYAFDVCQKEGQLEWQPVPEYLPMRLFGGKGLVTAGNDVHYDFSETWIPLRAQSHPRYVEEATLTTDHFDGVEPDCVWHRLMIDACIPPETRVEIRSRAANELFDLERTAWQREPSLYLRGDGSELPFMPRRGAVDEKGRARKSDRDGTWELLFQRARGRYLQLEIKLSGNERTTPHVRAVRAYYPRFSYLNNYLPSIYREDDQSASFLDRFLANFEGMYTSLEDKIATVQVLFDVRSAPPETLAWLAQWFGIVFDPAWDEAKQRLFIRHAMEFFQYRGTIHGLKMALHLALDKPVDETIFSLPTACATRRDSVRVVEKYLTRRNAGVIFGDTSDLVGPRRVTLSAHWQPAQGGANLKARYVEFAKARSGESQQLPGFTLNPDPASFSVWQEFARETLGFVPSFGPAAEAGQWQSFLRHRHADLATLNAKHQTNYAGWEKIVLPRDWPTTEDGRKDWQAFQTATANANTVRVWWQEFLARRYGRIRALNQVYGTNWPAFELVSLFDVLPPDGAPLEDWHQFESIAVQQQLTAHRFTVLLPVPVSLAFNPDEQQLRFDLSRRIIDLEKPAHTVFDVKFYWEMFRIGEARLALDTLLDQGSRAPQLLPGLALNRGFIGSSYLAAPAAEDAHDRYVLGRDPLDRDPRKERRP